MLGTDVPSTFEPLDVGPIIPGEVRSPGYLRTNTVREIGVDISGSVAVAWCVRSYLYLASSNHRLDTLALWNPARGWLLHSPINKVPP